MTKSNIVQHKILNEATGELEARDFIEVDRSSKRSKIRGGFNIMYHKSYEEVTEAVINSNKDLRLFNWITNEFTYSSSVGSIVYSRCSIDISSSAFGRMVRKLVEVGYLKKVGRGLYKLNPFIYVPYRANATELQEEWRHNGVS